MLQKIEHYISALAQLEQAVAIYQKSQQDADQRKDRGRSRVSCGKNINGS